jgi:hypothetical protein
LSILVLKAPLLTNVTFLSHIASSLLIHH